ncbi:MAG: hypothetical protein J0H39_08125 [Alphaproteobacteria bacterium]|nr:hypothetical protein [Alphaproteobacteria bacterium]MBN9496707.1 hypothetical protein [Alphaproteobacteria bacterium]
MEKKKKNPSRPTATAPSKDKRSGPNCRKVSPNPPILLFPRPAGPISREIELTARKTNQSLENDGAGIGTILSKL